MGELTGNDNTLERLQDGLEVIRRWTTPRKATEVLQVLAESAAQGRGIAAKLEAEGRFGEALVYYEALAATFSEAMALTGEDDRADLESITNFWALVAKAKRDALGEVSRSTSVARTISSPATGASSALPHEYQARESSQTLTPSRPTKDRRSFDRRRPPDEGTSSINPNDRDRR